MLKPNRFHPSAPCHAFPHDAVRLQQHALAYSLADFNAHVGPGRGGRALITLREKLVRIGARIVRHGR
jgi:hypothetical protein